MRFQRSKKTYSATYVKARIRALSRTAAKYQSKYYSESLRANAIAARLSVAEYYVAELTNRLPHVAQEIEKTHGESAPYSTVPRFIYEL